MVNCSCQLFHLAVKRFLPESFTQKKHFPNVILVIMHKPSGKSL